MFPPPLSRMEVTSTPDFLLLEHYPDALMTASQPIYPPESPLPGSIQEADPDATSQGSGTTDSCVQGSMSFSRRTLPNYTSMSRNETVRGFALAPAETPVVSNPDTGDLRGIPASSVVPQGMFSLRGELVHAFVSYRVDTEGMIFSPELDAAHRAPLRSTS